jgi:hypothetical protein
LDIHKKTISYCVKDNSGKVLSEGKMPATRKGDYSLRRIGAAKHAQWHSQILARCHYLSCSPQPRFEAYCGIGCKIPQKVIFRANCVLNGSPGPMPGAPSKVPIVDPITAVSPACGAPTGA